MTDILVTYKIIYFTCLQVDASALRKPDDKKLAADLKDTFLPDKNVDDLQGNINGKSPRFLIFS